MGLARETRLKIQWASAVQLCPAVNTSKPAARIDRYRKVIEEDEMPLRSVAIRALIEAGLTAEGF